MKKTWFTSDTHFGSQRTLELSKRRFDSVHKMDAFIIEQWNKLVDKDENVYHLGDFGDYEKAKMLNGNIVLIFGNYERKDMEEKFNNDFELFAEYLHSMGFSIVCTSGQEYSSKDLGRLWMCHEPSKSRDSRFNLFGHIHKLQMVRKNGLNVGIDCHNLRPISVETVLFYKNAIENHYDNEVFGE